MATDVRGHTVPAAGDHPSRAALLALALSTRDPIMVASTAARATKVTELASAGITPSTSNPIFFFRADAGSGRELEYTTNGTTFITVPGAGIGAGPYAMAAGSVGISLAAAAFGSATVTFPASRFTVAPIVMITQTSLPASSGTLIPKLTGTSTSGFTAYAYTGAGNTVTTSATFQWIAVQMTAATAEG